MSKFNYVSLFSGVGGFEQALNNLGGTCVMASEIDKFAEKSYQALYGHVTAGDITKIDAKDIPEHDLLVGGFPCQSFSVAGKRGGFDDARGTMFFEVARIVAEKKPRIALLENVKGLVGHDKGKTLDTIVKTLNDIGYRVDFEVLNSKYFGVPQNRERIFIVAIREDLVENEAWNIEGTTVVPKGKRRISGYEDVKTFNFDWPEQTEVSTRLRDILEPAVDERFYLPEEKTARLVAQLEEKDRMVGTVGHHPFSKKFEFKGYNSEISPALIATDYKAHKTVLKSDPQMLGHVDIKGHDAIKRVYSAESVRPTLTTIGGGHREPKIAVVGHTGTGGQRGRVIGTGGLSPCLSATEYKQPTQVADEIRPVLTPDRLNKRQNGRRFKEDGEESFTLTSQDRHGVAISKGDGLDDKEKERDTFEVLRALSEEIGEEKIAEWRLRILDTFQSSEVLRQEVYGEVVLGEKVDGKSELVHGSQMGKGINRSEGMREVWVEGEPRRTPQGRELEEQFAGELASIMSKLPYSGTPKKVLYDLRETAQRTRVLRHALSTIQEIWEPSLYQNKKYRIRKLTPLETFRLQGFSDEAHQTLVDAGISDSQRYKQAGNAVTVNVIEVIGERLLPYLAD